MSSLRLFFTSIAVILISCSVSFPIYDLVGLESLLEFGKFTKWFAILNIAAIVSYSVSKRMQSAAAIFGYSPPPPHIPKCLSSNFFIGFGLLVAYGLTLYYLNFLVLEEHYDALAIALSLASTIPVAFLIALIEETYFRGALLYDFQIRRQPIIALLLPAAFYAGLHGFNVDGDPTANSPWYYGLVLLFDAPLQTCSETNCLGAGGVLMLFGIFLAALRLAGATLYTCIGIHAGAIVAIKMIKKLSDPNPAMTTVMTDYSIWLIAALMLLLCCLWAMAKIPEQRSIAS